MLGSSCTIGNWQRLPDLLVVPIGRQVFPLAPMPEDVSLLANEIVAASDLKCRLTVLWLRHADGFGGFCSPGLVALGAKDLNDLATTVFHRSFKPVPPHEVPYYMPGSLRTYEQIWQDCVAYVIAHEVGHALQFERRAVFASSIDRECDADFWAGVIAEHFGWDAYAHQAIARTIGCVGASCMHPTPRDRVACHVHGRNAERRSIAQQFYQPSFG